MVENHVNVSIPLGQAGFVSGAVSVPCAFRPGESDAVVLAHGAANNMDNPLLRAVADGLAEAGFLALRFNFPYVDKGRKSPDSRRILELTWRSAYDFLITHRDFRPRFLIAAGKSMGGRVASQMVAEGVLPVKRLIFLGYPLHAPGKKKPLRDSHLFLIRIPMLFFAGSRDPLCDLTLLRGVLSRLTASWTLEVIQGGDHSFRVPKSSDLSESDVCERIVEVAVQWLARFPFG